MLQLAEENQRLRRRLKNLETTIIRIDRERSYWVAYQQQTALEAGKAQDIMVAEIVRLSQKAGVPEDESFVAHLDLWQEKRVRGENAHPFSASFQDIGASPNTPVGDLLKEE